MTPASFAGRKALVIDDDPEAVELAAYGLESAGFEVFRARDGEEGLLLARQRRPDLVVLDLAMPGMMGYDVLKAMRQDAGLSGATVIVVTGKNYNVDMREAKALGAAGYLVKPFSMSELLRLAAAAFDSGDGAAAGGS